MPERLQDYKPLGLREKLNPDVYQTTIFREEEDEDPEGELSFEGDDENPEPLVVYKFWFKPFRGDEMPLTATEFEHLCTLEGEGINLANLKSENQLPGSMGAKTVSSLEGKLIPKGMANVRNGTPDVYTLSELASGGEYFAEEEYVSGGEE
jgi:hypothetical protein